MTPEMLAAIRAYLALLSEEPEPADDKRLRQLARSLDRLAFAFHDVVDDGCSSDDPDPEVPPYDTWRAAAVQRFPDLGFYPVAMEADGFCAPTGVGDAIDDIADIAQDLATVLWYVENVGPRDGAWYLTLMHSHWGQHLVELRAHLHAKQHDYDVDSAARR